MKKSSIKKLAAKQLSASELLELLNAKADKYELGTYTLHGHNGNPLFDKETQKYIAVTLRIDKIYLANKHIPENWTGKTVQENWTEKNIQGG